MALHTHQGNNTVSGNKQNASDPGPSFGSTPPIKGGLFGQTDAIPSPGSVPASAQVPVSRSAGGSKRFLVE